VDSILIGGGSIAAVTAARELRKHGFAGRLAIVEQETDGPYRRPEVSKGLLGGHLNAAGIALPWPELDLDLVLGAHLDALHVADQRLEVTHADGRTERLAYDGLVVATGSEARGNPFDPTVGKVHTLRTAADSHAMKPDLDAAAHVVIVGGGFIGLEAAAVARKLGKTVTVVEAEEIPLARILGDEFGQHLLGTHTSHGVNLHTSATVSELESGPQGDVTAVVLSNGERLPADVVLVAIGSVPATAWLMSSGLALEDGLECDQTCAAVGAEGIVAAGDVASWMNPLYERRMRVEHWTNAVEQGAYAARRLLGVHDPGGFVSAPYFWSDQYGVRLQSVGSTVGHDEARVLERTDDSILVAYTRNGHLLAVAGLNTGTTVMKLRKHVLSAATLDEAGYAVPLP
jgi:NADPH-dependent 2,4-dienoyl-CoA reductase/sulfur reductase-like enzyme